MKKIKTTALAVLLCAAMITTAGCTTYNNFKEAFFGEKGKAAETVTIGVLEPQTGNDSPMGELEIQGIELANKLMPEVLGKKVELIYADTQSSIYVAETAVEDLIDKGPAVVLGSYGDAVSLTAGQALGAKKIPAIAITATNPLITQNNEYYFRVTFTDASQGRAIAHFVQEHLQQSKAAVVRMQKEDTAAEMVSQFGQKLRELTEDEECITASIEIPQNAKDYTEYVEELKNAGVQAVFAPISLKNAEKLFAAVEKAGLQNMTFIGPKDWHTDKLAVLQAEYPGIRMAAASDFTSSMAEEAEQTGLYEKFIEAYEKEYGSSEPPEAVALGFDAYMIAVSAIEKAGGTDGTAVKEALQATEGFEGASGEISFDEIGEPAKTINIDIIEGGKYVSVFTVK